nr:hypothetical protein [Candidatus Tectomicrobia bacterium]
MMPQRIATFLGLPLFCLAIWAVNQPPALHAAVPDEGDESINCIETLGSRVCLYYESRVLEVCDVLQDGNSAFAWWNYGYNNRNTPTNRLEIGGSGR